MMPIYLGMETTPPAVAAKVKSVDPRLYRQIYLPRHPKCSASGFVYEHVLVAERALGKPLPRGAEVHHVNGHRRDNANHNLVICQDRGYHMLLHARMRIARAGGNPDTDKICMVCRELKPRLSFGRRVAERDGLMRLCVLCNRQHVRKYKARRRAQQGAV